MNTINDGPDPWGEYSTVRDPIKLMNVYNTGYCGIFGPTLDGVFQGIGFETGRAFSVPNWNHCTTEVWYDGGWHLFDPERRSFHLAEDNETIASYERLHNNPSLATRTHDGGFASKGMKSHDKDYEAFYPPRVMPGRAIPWRASSSPIRSGISCRTVCPPRSSGCCGAAWPRTRGSG